MRSPIGYFGGKSRLARRIIERIPEHRCYCEPFAGAAWVTFRKEPSKVEVLNDLDGELIRFWKVVQRHPREFMAQFDRKLVSRDLFAEAKGTDPQWLTDIERAARYFYLQRQCFAGIARNPRFAGGPSRASNFNLQTLPEIVDATHQRLKRVWIEHLDFADCMRRYDSEDSFFYVDPPYDGYEKAYPVSFADDDLERLRDTLAGLKGRWLLSLNDTERVRRLFADFIIEEVDLKYSAANERASPGVRGRSCKELLIRNYEVPDAA